MCHPSLDKKGNLNFVNFNFFFSAPIGLLTKLKLVLEQIFITVRVLSSICHLLLIYFVMNTWFCGYTESVNQDF